jgi:hypothetical protein
MSGFLRENLVAWLRSIAARCQMLCTRSRSTAQSDCDVYKYITMWTQGPAPDIVTASCSAATQQSQNQYAHTTPDA